MKKLLISSVLIGTVFLSACSNTEEEAKSEVINTTKKDEIETISVGANYLEYDEETNLFKDTELVLIAEVTTDFLEREHVVEYFQSDSAQKMNEIEDYYTKTPINVKKVLKAPKDSKIEENSELTIIEPIALVDDANGKRILTTEHYEQLEKGKTYVLYLNKNTYGQYSVYNMNNGRFDLDTESNVQSKSRSINTRSTEATEHSDIHNTMKEDVLQKFKAEIEEIKENK